MKARIDHGSTTDPGNGIWKMADEITPTNLMLTVGQELKLYEHDPDTKFGIRRKYVKIVKLYRHHALCKVNGRHMESYTYNELYTMGMGADNTEEIYQNLPEEQKQAFDHCIDLGQIEEAGEILAGQERERKNRH